LVPSWRVKISSEFEVGSFLTVVFSAKIIAKTASFE